MAKKLTIKQEYRAKNEYLGTHFEKVSPMELYRDIFPEGSLERVGHPEDQKPNAILTIIQQSEDGKRRGMNRLVFDDLAEIKNLSKLQLGVNDLVVTSAMTYCGKTRREENAYSIYGFIIDLDGVTVYTMTDLFYQIRGDLLPECSYVINSGNGLHLYYLFERPIPMYPYSHKPLDELKHALTEIVWNAYTSTIPKEKKQFQGIFQGFRMPGTPSKLGKRYPVVAFRTGGRQTLNKLNSYLPSPLPIDFDEIRHFSINEAKEKYPEWYERRIVKGESRGRWYNKRALYDWWIGQIQKGAFDGNRYNCICVLVTYAIKCGIEKEEALQDAMALLPVLERRTEQSDNHFTEQDIHDAFRFYDESYVTYSKKAIEAKTKIILPDNHRKYRKQKDHLEIARAIRDIQTRQKGKNDWRDGNGRPKGSQNKRNRKEEVLQVYMALHPEERNVSKIARECGLSRTTVYKYISQKGEKDV